MTRLDATWLYGLPKDRTRSIAMSQQLLPLEVSGSTGEPFLCLPLPRNNIILTPPRLHDVDAIIIALNDPKVYNWMAGLPLPYQPEHGLAWLSEQMEEAEKVLRHLERPAFAIEQSEFALGCPVRIIRETKEDGTDIFLGYVSIYRSERKDVLDDKERKAVLAADATKKAGDPTIVWDIAGEIVAFVSQQQHVEQGHSGYVVPERHGQGIMTAAMSALIYTWAIPRLNAHRIQASVLEGNAASIRVLEKLGFKLKGGVFTCEKARGEWLKVQQLEWTREQCCSRKV